MSNIHKIIIIGSGPSAHRASGFLAGSITGGGLQNVKEQSIHLGTEIITETIIKVDLSEKPFKIWSEGSQEHYYAESLIIATYIWNVIGSGDVSQEK